MEPDLTDCDEPDKPVIVPKRRSKIRLTEKHSLMDDRDPRFVFKSLFKEERKPRR